MSKVPYHSSRQAYDYLVAKTTEEFACIDYLKSAYIAADFLPELERLYLKADGMHWGNGDVLVIQVGVGDKTFDIKYYDQKDCLTYLAYLYQIVEAKLNGEPV